MTFYPIGIHKVGAKLHLLPDLDSDCHSAKCRPVFCQKIVLTHLSNVLRQLAMSDETQCCFEGTQLQEHTIGVASLESLSPAYVLAQSNEIMSSTRIARRVHALSVTSNPPAFRWQPAYFMNGLIFFITFKLTCYVGYIFLDTSFGFWGIFVGYTSVMHLLDYNSVVSNVRLLSSSRSLIFES